MRAGGTWSAGGVSIPVPGDGFASCARGTAPCHPHRPRGAHSRTCELQGSQIQGLSARTSWQCFLLTPPRFPAGSSSPSPAARPARMPARPQVSATCCRGAAQARRACPWTSPLGWQQGQGAAARRWHVLLAAKLRGAAGFPARLGNECLLK